MASLPLLNHMALRSPSPRFSVALFVMMVTTGIVFLVATRCKIFDFEIVSALGLSMFMMSRCEIVCFHILMFMFLVRIDIRCHDGDNGNVFSRRNKMQDI